MSNKISNTLLFLHLINIDGTLQRHKTLSWKQAQACSEQILKRACCISPTGAAAVSYNEILSERVNFPLDREQAGGEGAELQARRRKHTVERETFIITLSRRSENTM